MSTHNTTGTHTHNVTYITQEIQSTLSQLVDLLGLSRDKLLEDWDVTDRGIKAWLNSGHLKRVTLEVFDSSTPSIAAHRWDMEIDYNTDSYLEGLGRWKNKEVIIAAMAKYGSRRDNLTYRVIVHNKDGRPDVQGWSSAQYKSVEKLKQSYLGTTIGTESVNVNSSVWG